MRNVNIKATRFVCQGCGYAMSIEPMIKIKDKDSLLEEFGISATAKKVPQYKLLHLFGIRIFGNYTYTEKSAEYIIKNMIAECIQGDRFLPGITLSNCQARGKKMTFTGSCRTLAEELTTVLSDCNLRLTGIIKEDVIEIDVVEQGKRT